MKTLRCLGWVGATALAAACGSDASQPGTKDAAGMDAPIARRDGGIDARADGRVIMDARTHDTGKNSDGSTDASSDLLLPGQYCGGGSPTIRFDPPLVVLAVGHGRPVRAIVEPDLCSPTTLSFTSSNAGLVAAPASGAMDLRHPTYEFTVSAAADAGALGGTATLTATIPASDAGAAGTATLPVFVNNGALPTCATTDVATGTLSTSATILAGSGGLAQASLSVPPGAFTRTDEFALPSFPGTVACANDDLTQVKAPGMGVKGHPAAPGGLVSIGPAVTFTAGAPLDMPQSLRRELDFSIPVNPAIIPTNGRLRHMQVLFMSPGGVGVAAAPRTMTIANPAITQTASGQFVAQFSSPWFGTYQAAFSPDAGTVTRSRQITHRAVIGVSMGAGGAGSFGFRHHDQFDVISPLGGPSDWTWLLWYLETYALGGFCPQTLITGAPNPAYPNCPAYAPNLYPFHETYAHTEDFNHWFYQDGSGNGGTFNRASYIQIFTDLALMEGNPGGQNYDPSNANANLAFSFLPAGPQGTDPWVAGNWVDAGLPGSCAVAVNPLSPDPNPNDPPLAVQQNWQNQCTASRCLPENMWTAPASPTSGYFDARFNPTGQYPVITFCDGNQNGVSPYDDTWAPPTVGTQVPMSVTLAVDINGNGVRDENEPVLAQGQEPWSDVGTDGLADVDEPGYDPVNNPDPNQDDYDFQVNPGGTEGDHRYEMGEPFQDYGLDGVPNTPQLKAGGFDYGEGDGLFTTTTGLTNFYASDPHSIIHQWSTAIPGGALTDTALLRINVWADGGVRDLFNFESVANHTIGAIASRKGSDGTQLRSTAYYNGFDRLPGQIVGNEAAFNINTMLWADIVDNPHVRYGTVDATAAMIMAGDGQHVGTPPQLLDRFQSTIYFAGTQWPDADRTLTDTTVAQVPGGTDASGDAGLGNNCPGGLCTFNFSGSNRTGPVYVQLPPGYGLPENIQRNVRYPVIYALHGYGQTPDGLEALSIISTDLMNDATRSSATRLPKMILVYVDGRCRYSSDTPPQPECIEGSFYLNSPRPDTAHPGTNVAQFDTWFDELVPYIDQQFRTMAPTELTVTE